MFTLSPRAVFVRVPVVARLPATWTHVHPQNGALVLPQAVLDIVRSVNLLGLAIILAKVAQLCHATPGRLLDRHDHALDQIRASQRQFLGGRRGRRRSRRRRRKHRRRGRARTHRTPIRAETVVAARRLFVRSPILFERMLFGLLRE